MDFFIGIRAYDKQALTKKLIAFYSYSSRMLEYGLVAKYYISTSYHFTCAKHLANAIAQWKNLCNLPMYFLIISRVEDCLANNF